MKHCAQAACCCAVNVLGAGVVLGVFILAINLVIILMAPILGPHLPLM
jgi:hypothetical protein